MQIISPYNVSNRTLYITSPAFGHLDYIPTKYTCEGVNKSPALVIDLLPKKTKSIAIIMDDPDAPIGTWVHWVAWNIPPKKIIKENEPLLYQGINDFGLNAYAGPCPMKGTHRYYFKIYALDTILDLPKNATKYTLEKAMKAHVISSGDIVGLYKKIKN